MARSTATASTAHAPDVDTRTRLVEAALLLFHRHGYHGVGISDILATSGISRGSLYHFFPDGKEALAVAVVQGIAGRILETFEQSRDATTEQLLRRLGARLSRWVQRTGGGTLAMLAAFVVESHGVPKLRHAVQAAYRELEQLVQRRLQSDGYSEADAHERAQLAIALFEGGAMLSQGLAQPKAFSRTVEHAARLCAPPVASSR